MALATSLLGALDARDKYTAGHSVSVAKLAERIAEALDLGVRERTLAYRCGLVHDIGKIGLPVGLLEKSGTLTAEEISLIQEHPVIGADILARSEMFAEMAGIVRSHYERVDEAGYPDRLAGSAIPILSRIITVSDAFDAMTSDRPHRQVLPWNIAVERLSEGVGEQFDSRVVSAFMSIAASEQSYRRLAGAGTSESRIAMLPSSGPRSGAVNTGYSRFIQPAGVA